MSGLCSANVQYVSQELFSTEVWVIVSFLETFVSIPNVLHELVLGYCDDNGKHVVPASMMRY